MALKTLLVLCLSFISICCAQVVTSLDVNSFNDPNLHRSTGWGSHPNRTERLGQSMWFNFSGTGVNIALFTYNTFGFVTISLDGNQSTIDTYRDAEHVGHMRALCDLSLADGIHNVSLTNSGPSDSSADSGLAWLFIASLSYTSASSNSSSGSSASFNSSPPDSTSPPVSTASETQTNVGIVAGGVFGALVVTALITTTVSCFLRRRRRSVLGRSCGESTKRLSLDPYPTCSSSASGPLPSFAPVTAPEPPWARPRPPLSTAPSGFGGTVGPSDSASNAVARAELAEIAQLREIVEQLQVSRQASQKR